MKRNAQEWAQYREHCTRRMGEFIRMDAAPLLIKQEARLILMADAGGRLRAIAKWLWEPIATWCEYHALRLGLIRIKGIRFEDVQTAVNPRSVVSIEDLRTRNCRRSQR